MKQKGNYQQDIAERIQIMEGNGRMLPMFPDNSVDCIITDHPWLDTVSNKGGNRSFADYECFSYELEDFKEKARVLKPGCFLAEFLPAENANNYRQLYKIKDYAAQCGLEYYSKVSWKKGRFVSNTGRKAKNTQDILIFTKGKARCLRLDRKKTKQTGEPCYMSGAAGMLPAMFDIEPVPREQKIHQSELPVELCEQLIEYLTKEGEVVLDQFAGSGAVGIAAFRKGRKSILIEKSGGTMKVLKQRLYSESILKEERDSANGRTTNHGVRQSEQRRTKARPTADRIEKVCAGRKYSGR